MDVGDSTVDELGPHVESHAIVSDRDGSLSKLKTVLLTVVHIVAYSYLPLHDKNGFHTLIKLIHNNCLFLDEDWLQIRQKILHELFVLIIFPSEVVSRFYKVLKLIILAYLEVDGELFEKVVEKEACN